jgi:hypothetical protein
MRRVLTSTLLALGIAASSITAVQAQSGTSSNMAVRGASTLVGTAFGWPISVCKTQYRDITGFTRDMVGDSKNPLLWTAAVLLCVPSGAVNGMMEGVAMAPVNAWNASKDAPFSAATFSLRDDK